MARRTQRRRPGLPAVAGAGKQLVLAAGLAVAPLGLIWPAGAAAQGAAASPVEALFAGEAYGQLRPRYEYVDQEGFGREANAFTLRTQLGYRTGAWKGIHADLQFEDVRALGDDRFNSTVNGRTDYPVVADPDSTEVNVARLSYAGPANTTFDLGRQIIALDNERFVGPTNWRQNSVTMDALAVRARPAEGVQAFYAYVDNVNRLFGEEHPTQSDFAMSSHLVNASAALPFGRLTGYGYFLEFDDAAAVGNSTRTLGLRLDGERALDETWRLLYTAEVADQGDYADGRPTNDAGYYHLVLGAGARGATLKLAQERLGGDGRYGFSTPLATAHPFNGWADRFVDTPRDGLVDTYLDLSATYRGFNLGLAYHDFRSDHDAYTYGREWNFLAARPLGKRLKVLAKYAAYRADDNAVNAARNPVQRTDVRKLWLMAEFTF